MINIESSDKNKVIINYKLKSHKNWYIIVYVNANGESSEKLTTSKRIKKLYKKRGKYKIKFFIFKLHNTYGKSIEFKMT